MVSFSDTHSDSSTMTHSSHQKLWAAMEKDELLHALYCLHQAWQPHANPLTTHCLRHVIDGDQDATGLSGGAVVSLSGHANWVSQIQIPKVDENDLSEGHQDFFIVTSAFTERVCQQQNHQDGAK